MQDKVKITRNIKPRQRRSRQMSQVSQDIVSSSDSSESEEDFGLSVVPQIHVYKRGVIVDRHTLTH